MKRKWKRHRVQEFTLGPYNAIITSYTTERAGDRTCYRSYWRAAAQHLRRRCVRWGSVRKEETDYERL